MREIQQAIPNFFYQMQRYVMYWDVSVFLTDTKRYPLFMYIKPVDKGYRHNNLIYNPYHQYGHVLINTIMCM